MQLVSNTEYWATMVSLISVLDVKLASFTLINTPDLVLIGPELDWMDMKGVNIYRRGC